MLKKKRKEYKQQQKTLKERIANILKSPAHSDKVYQCLNRVFKKNWDYHQNREDKNRFKIRRLAIKRFYLGYPPRKNGDNSIGDAINWEYVIDCALRSGKDIIIVSRDGDFGITYENKSFLNDWLLKEFKERISTHRKIELTNSLSYALKEIQSNITDEMEDAEKEFIESTNKYEAKSSKDDEFFEKMKKLFEKE